MAWGRVTTHNSEGLLSHSHSMMPFSLNFHAHRERHPSPPLPPRKPLPSEEAATTEKKEGEGRLVEF